MRKLVLAAFCLTAVAAGNPGNALAQGRPDPQAAMAAQKKALAKLAFVGSHHDSLPGAGFMMRPIACTSCDQRFCSRTRCALPAAVSL